MASTTTSSLCTWLVAACMSVTCHADRTKTPHAMFRSSKKSRYSQFNVCRSTHSGIPLFFQISALAAISQILLKLIQSLNLVLLSGTQGCVFFYFLFFFMLVRVCVFSLDLLFIPVCFYHDHVYACFVRVIQQWELV